MARGSAHFTTTGNGEGLPREKLIKHLSCQPSLIHIKLGTATQVIFHKQFVETPPAMLDSVRAANVKIGHVR
jgi:hypothetical protein